MSSIHKNLSNITKALENTREIYGFLLDIDLELMKAQERICDCYCKFPGEYHSMYEDTDVAMENLDREKCSMCPLMNL